MKLSSLSKTARTIGLVAVLSVTVGSSISQTVQAQTEPVTIEEKKSQWVAADIEEWKMCNRVSQAEANESSEWGDSFFNELKGINFSNEQQSAYDDLFAQAEAKRTEVYENTLSIEDPTAPLSFGYGGDIPQEVLAEIQAALEKNSNADQKEALEREFGQYVEFSGSYINYISPEQAAQIDQITEDFYAQAQGLMTPEQLPQYRENMAARLRINEVCNGWVPVSADRDLGQITYANFSPAGRLVDSIPELLQ